MMVNWAEESETSRPKLLFQIHIFLKRMCMHKIEIGIMIRFNVGEVFEINLPFCPSKDFDIISCYIDHAIYVL